MQTSVTEEGVPISQNASQEEVRTFFCRVMAPYHLPTLAMGCFGQAEFDVLQKGWVG